MPGCSGGVHPPSSHGPSKEYPARLPRRITERSLVDGVVAAAVPGERLAVHGRPRFADDAGRGSTVLGVTGRPFHDLLDRRFRRPVVLDLLALEHVGASSGG